ncbi:MAG TPA: wax ester/triacylglycerol synthase family O-acyltransferase, partial [Candidatus Binataceae bacterium]|nr:wax ester/triacylglycerol synthase family O-acyltransferase [Candidatus Binataceae bacterium]
DASKLSRRLTAQDASFLYAESRNGPTHIGSLLFFEGHIPFENFVHHINGRLHLLTRYRQKLLEVPFRLNHATWEDDQDFHIENHVFRHVMPADSNDDDLMRAAMDINERPLDRARPLWEMHSFEGLSGDRTALLSRVHHSMVDGVSGIELLTVLMDFKRDAAPPEPPKEEWTAKPAPNVVENFFDGAYDGAQTQLGIYRRLTNAMLRPSEFFTRAKLLTEAAFSFARMMRPIAAVPWTRRLVTSRRALAWSSFSFGEIRAIRNALGGTVNDVVLTLLTEGAARYLAHHGYASANQNFRVGCPVNVRKNDEGGALGNRVSLMFPEVPAEPMAPAARLRVVNDETERIKQSNAPQGLELLMEGAELTPPSMASYGGALAMNTYDAAVAIANMVPEIPLMPRFTLPCFGMTFLATNVPGVMVPQYLSGHECLAMVGLVPLAGNVGYSVAITSYNQKLYFGMMAEPTSMPDVGLMKTYVDETFEELKAAAGIETPTEARAAA